MAALVAPRASSCHSHHGLRACISHYHPWLTDSRRLGLLGLVRLGNEKWEAPPIDLVRKLVFFLDRRKALSWQFNYKAWKIFQKIQRPSQNKTKKKTIKKNKTKHISKSKRTKSYDQKKIAIIIQLNTRFRIKIRIKMNLQKQRGRNRVKSKEREKTRDFNFSK